MRLANIQGYSIYLEILEILKSLSGGKWISWVFLSALEITESWVWENSLDLGWTKASDEEIPDVGMDIKKQWVSPVFLAPRHLSENGVCPNSDDARPWSSALLCTARWHGGGTQRGDTWGQPSGGGGFVTSRAALWGPPAQRCRGRVTLLRMETPGGQTAKQCPERRAGVLWLSTFLKLQETRSQPAPEPFSLELCCLAEFKSCSRDQSFPDFLGKTHLICDLGPNESETWRLFVGKYWVALERKHRSKFWVRCISHPT